MASEESNNSEGPKEESFFKKFLIYFVIFGAAFGSVAVAFMVVGVLWWKTSGLKSGYGGPTIDCTSAKAFADKPVEWKVWTAQAANKYLEGDQAILIALIQRESGWDSDASAQPKSSATGLGQFIDSTAQNLNDGGSYFFKNISNGGYADDDDRKNPQLALPAIAYLFKTAIDQTKKEGHTTPKELMYRWAYIDHYHTHQNSAQLAAATTAANDILEFYSGMLSDGSCKPSDEGIGTPDGDEAGEGCEGNVNGLGVPCYDQRYIWHNTKGESACGMTSVYMVLKYYADKGINIDPKFLNAKQIGQSSYFYKYIRTKAYFSDGIRSTHTYTAQIKGSADWSIIKSQLNAGNPVILYTNRLPGHSGRHVVVLVGYSEQNGSTFYYYNDPWGAKRKTIIEDQLNNMLDYPDGRAYLYVDIY